MKRIMLLSLTLIFAFCGVVYAASINGQYKGKDIVKVLYDGKEVKPDSVPGYMENGNTMVPLGLLRKMGFTVEWNQSKLTANVTTKTVDASNKTALTLDQVKSLSNTVAIIYALDDQGKRWRQGSGFIINSRGLLITAYHVAEEEGQLRELEVEVNGKTYKVPKGVYVFADQQKDVFGVYLQDSVAFPYLKVNDVLPDFGAHGFTISNPNGNRNVVTEGYVSTSFKEGDRHFISGMFKTEGGSSGGPLLNEYGEVMGIVTNGGDGITITTAIIDAKTLYSQTF